MYIRRRAAAAFPLTAAHLTGSIWEIGSKRNVRFGLADKLFWANHRLYPFWGQLTTALQTGLPQNEAKDGGPDPFAALYADPARLKEFLRAMTGVSHGGNISIARKFPWSRYRSAVDVGTAQGDLITQAVVITVTLSLVVHSLTTPLGIRLLARGGTAREPASEATASGP